MQYSRHIFDNGLTLLVHEDHDTPLATVNLLYGVGARDEDPSRTGFAHLFEHLMFGGTSRVPDFDAVVNALGGESNAFTNNDYTNYYITVPGEHLADALFLEADRMGGLDLTQHALEVQQRVVVEEYHQRYLNQPYGDVWLLLRPLCYRVHPYRWCTIGADIDHVRQATLDDVRAFFDRYYCPNNAVLAVAGAVCADEAVRLVGQHFGSIPMGRQCLDRHYPTEPEPTEARRLCCHRDVPTEAFYRAYPICDHYHPDFYAYDLLSDLLGNGKSSRLYRRLVVEQPLLSEVDACVSGEVGDGLLLLTGKLRDGVAYEQVASLLDEVLQELASQPVGDYELQKVVNKYESNFVYAQYKAADRAQSLCYYEWLGDVGLVNSEPERYRRVTPVQIADVAARCFQPHRACTLNYCPIPNTAADDGRTA